MHSHLPKGTRVAGRLVEVLSRAQSPVFESRTDADGSVEIRLVGFHDAKSGDRGLCVGTEGQELSVLINGQCMKIKRHNVRLIEE